MADVQHSAQMAGDGIHVIKAYEHADTTARTTTESYASTDVGKVSHQTDDDSFWLVKASTPTFIQLTDDMGGDVTGKQGAATVEKIRGYAVQDAAPSDGEGLIWSASNARYEPGPVGGAEYIWIPYWFRYDFSGTGWLGPDGAQPAYNDEAWTQSWGSGSVPTGNDGRHTMHVPWPGIVTECSFKIELTGLGTENLEFALIRLRHTNQGVGSYAEETIINTTFSSIDMSENIQKSTVNGDMSVITTGSPAANAVLEFDEFLPSFRTDNAGYSDTVNSVRCWVKVERTS